MKKFYVVAVVCLFLALKGFCQNYYWIGPANGDWSNAGHWSNTSGGPAAADYPRLQTDNVILNSAATISLNTSVELNSLTVTGTGTVIKITGTGGAAASHTITAYGSSALNPALSIAAGCQLENSAENNTTFTYIFEADAIAEIDGEWLFTGDINNDAFASFFLGVSGDNTRVNVNSGGTITVGTNGYIEPNEETGDDYLVFHANSKLKLLANGPIVPAGNYNANSTIEITGVTTASVLFEETGAVGNITYNCPGQSNGGTPLYLSLLTFSVDGDLNILSTNDNELALLSYTSTTGLPSREATIKGDLNIQGDSKVAIAHNDGPELPNHLHVEGNVIMNGTSLSLQTSSFITDDPTVLHVKGNIQHTAGTLGALSSVTNQTAHLFVIDMNGTTGQTVSSHSGTFDNTNNQVTLSINNAAGVTLLSSLQVGRANFNTTNKGILTTNTNILTINNTTPASVSGIVLELPATPSQGFVNGTVRRKAASTEPVILPVGTASNYRGVTVIPSTATATTYEAKFTNSAYGGTVLSPLIGVANYYWDVNRVGAGADAAVQISLPGAVPGAEEGHAIVVAKYDASAWVAVKGSTGTAIVPGNATTGTARSEVLSSFSPFTFGYGLQSALPTHLLSFTARKTGKESVELKWKLTDNSTPAEFEVLRSSDGNSFNKVGVVRGIELQYNYQFTDHAPVSNNNYYKLKMLDKDGTVTYSVIVTVSGDNSGITIQSIMPTMVRDRAKLTISSSIKSNLQLVVTDISGRMISTQQVTLIPGNQEVWLNTSRLSPGIFHVTAYGNGVKTQTLRFIKL